MARPRKIAVENVNAVPAKSQPRRAKQATDETDANNSKRAYLKQADVPIATLLEAMRIPQAIFDHYAGKPATPLQIGKALSVDPKGSQMRVLSGAAIAFGLVEGGAQAASITPTELARRILRPREEDEDVEAKREAVLKPRVFGEFLRRYDQSPFPRHDIALNVLEELGVPRQKVEEVLERLDDSARWVGFIEEINGKYYISLNSRGAAEDSKTQLPLIVESVTRPDDRPDEHEESLPPAPRVLAPPFLTPATHGSMKVAVQDDLRRRRVFITHGKDRALVDPIKKLLEYGELEPVISVERQSVSKPVPEKIMDDMRKCGAAIIHVDADRVITDDKGDEHVMLNPNVLIEIGAAMAFYGRRFILLVREGVKLPSNLQGLYEVRYSSDTLDATATIKLLEAMKDIKNYELPTDRDLDEE